MRHLRQTSENLESTGLLEYVLARWHHPCADPKHWNAATLTASRQQRV
jgi:hypothetical protein